jgi:Leucine-rich repeat (LRR) protein
MDMPPGSAAGAWKPKSQAQLAKWGSVQRHTLTVRARTLDPAYDAQIPSRAALTVRAPNARRKFAPGPSELQQRDAAERRAAAGAAAASSAARAAEAAAPTRSLDGFMLLEACHVEFPDEARRADLSGCGVGGVSAEDMPYFSNLSYLDLGDNAAPLEPLGELPALRELRFHCNLVRSLRGPLLGFAALEVLDLSFNALEPAAVAELAELPCLRELDLTRNGLQDVPPEIARCERLEVLVLESNRLHDVATLALLATVPRLKLLNVAHNQFTAVPAVVGGPGGGQGGDGGDGPAQPWAMLEELNLACNFIAREDDIGALVSMARLQLAVLYGNPLTEYCDPDASPLLDVPDARPGRAGQQRITTITVEPALEKRRPARGTYTFQMARVGAGVVPSAAHFRDAGNAALRSSSSSSFAAAAPRRGQALPAAAAAAPPAPEEADTSTVFLTGMDDGGDDEGQVPTAGFPDGGDSGVYRPSERELVPGAVFNAPLTRPQEGRKAAGGKDPAALRRALNGLRASLNAPPSSDALLDRSASRVDRPTELQRIRQRKRRPFVPKRLGAAARSSALSDLESALDSINARMTLAERDAGSAMNADSNMSELVNSCERVVDALG